MAPILGDGFDAQISVKGDDSDVGVCMLCRGTLRPSTIQPYRRDRRFRRKMAGQAPHSTAPIEENT